jgi:hypothetical protein
VDTLQEFAYGARILCGYFTGVCVWGAYFVWKLYRSLRMRHVFCVDTLQEFAYEARILCGYLQEFAYEACILCGYFTGVCV